jgi:Fe-Mn family superoxide dismutase
MAESPVYSLPALAFGYKDLEPHISEEQLRLHHEKHHQGYVTGANGIIEKLAAARKNGTDLDMKATLKEFSFHVGGHMLHSLFWGNLAPAGAGGKPDGAIGDAIQKEFGSFDRFKKEFTQAAGSVEGSGWAALGYCTQTRRPMIMQIEKHNVHVYPATPILMVIDVWEHAYYLDYKNARAKFVEAFWNIVNWKEVNSRLAGVL